MEEKEYTLVFVRKENQILLGMKKRGFGINKWNGFGGKIEKGETIEQAAIRELHEESGLLVEKLTHVGYLEFTMRQSNKFMKVHVYDTWEFTDKDIQETEEMRPQWFALEDIPFASMWPDDPYWLPLYLKGISFRGSFTYSDDDTIIAHDLKEQGAIINAHSTASG